MSTSATELRPSTNARPEAPLTAAKEPVASGLVPLLGVVWAVALIALGGVFVRDALIDAGVVSGPRYIDNAVDYLDNRTAAYWLVIVGVVAVLLGLALIGLALRPRARKEVAVKAQTGVFLTTGSVRRLAQAAASHVDGVDTASVSASRTKVAIQATTLTPDSEQTRAQIEDTVRRRLEPLESAPTIRVRVRTTEGTS